MKGSVCFTIFVGLILVQVESNPVDLSPNFLFGSIRNVTLGATSFISNSIQKQTDMILQAKDKATDYVSRVVAGPKYMLNNAKDATIDYIDSTASRGMEFKIRSLMEIFRANMLYGVPVLDLPVLEPLIIDHMDFETNHKDIGNISISIDNVTVSQLSTFVVDNVKLTILDGVSLALNLSVPTIQASGMYRVKGDMGKLFAVKGNGPFNLEAHGAKFYVHTVLGYSGTMYVKTLDIDYSVVSVNSFFENLFPDKEVDVMINQVLSEMAPEVLEVIKPELRPKLEGIMAQRVNATVARLTMGNILAILTGTADIRSFAHLTTSQL